MIENNIFAQFSSSLDRFGEFIDYPVVAGSVFNFQYNETLDSATIVLSQVPKEKRLSYIKPYDFVRVYDKSGNTGFDRVYLVDNFTETENNINEHIFGYTINLMSQTKLLEKIECPNLTVTHKVKDGVSTKKTILQKIQEYMELYVPKMKFTDDGENWSYEPLIKMSTGRQHFENGVFPEYGPEDFRILNNFIYRLEKTIPLASVVSVDIDDIDVDTVVVSNVVIDTDIEFTGTVAFDKINKELFLDLSSLSRGTVNVSFTVSYYDTLLMKRFDVPCADLPFNYPTLRQLLTMLMQQVGCIPTVQNRTLGYLDYQIDAQNFNNGEYTVDNTVNKITRGLSSDSFANTLVNMSSSVLDVGNEVICENLGFRDASKVMIKNLENLKLETKLPIYRVNKAIMKVPLNFTINYKPIGNTTGMTYHHPLLTNITISHEDDDMDLTLTFVASGINYPGETHTLDNLHLNFVDSNGDVIPDREIKIITPISMTNPTPENPGPPASDYNARDYTYEMDYDEDTDSWEIIDMSSTPTALSGNRYILHFNNNAGMLPLSTDKVWLYWYWDASTFVFIPPDWYTTYIDGQGNSTSSSNTNYTMAYSGFCRCDITDNVVEQSIRQYLDTNFTAMDSATTLKELAQFIYGTVQYTIGSTEITGFSTQYNKGKADATGWINYNYSYLENILNFIADNHLWSFDESQTLYQIPTWIDYQNIDFNLINQQCSRWAGNIVFDIYYFPLNSFNLSYVKSVEDIDFPLEQFDSGASGNSDFDRLSIHEQEQVDRIGNETLSISQRATNISQIQNFDNGPLYFMDDTNRSGSIDSGDNGTKYIIFRYSFSINNNCFNVSYTGSKDAILKDYFTSIRTKYRAYQYVDYNNSTLRKEKDVIFVRINDDYYDGDDKFYATNVRKRYFIDGFKQELDKTRKLKYAYKEGLAKNVNYSGTVNQKTKNDLSVVVTSNMFACIFEDYDNVSEGSFLNNTVPNDTIGGVQQTWQIWSDSYRDRHKVGFLDKLDPKYPEIKYPQSNFPAIYTFLLDQTAITTWLDTTFEAFATLMANDYTWDNFYVQMLGYANLPIINEAFYEYNVSFYIVDNNKSDSLNKTFYQDEAERINYTVEFIYYSITKDFIWTELFIENSTFVQNSEYSPNAIVDITGLPFQITKEKNSTGTFVTNNFINYINTGNFTNSQSETIHYISIKWSLIPTSIQQFKVCYYKNSTEMYDFVAFRRPTEDYTEDKKYYVTLNDTKSDYVLAEKDGILYRAYKVKSYKEGDTDEGRVVEEIFEEDS